MRVLIATDGSESASVAVELVAAMAWPPNTHLYAVQAVDAGTALFGGPWPPVPPVDTTRIEDELRAHATQQLEGVHERLRGPGREVETSVVAGRAADVILGRAEQSGAELIIVGSRGHGTIESMLLGSTSAEVIDHASVPVLVARRSAIRRVVLAYDGSACAERAASVLTEWGIFGASTICVVSVADAVAPWWASIGAVDEEVVMRAYEEGAEPSRSQHDQLARDMAERLRTAGLDARPERRDGDPASKIVSVAEHQDADLIIVGSHGRTGLARLLTGSVARNVLHHATCSVLVVREPRAAHEETTQEPPQG